MILSAIDPARRALFQDAGAIVDLGPGLNDSEEKMFPDCFHMVSTPGRAFWRALEPQQASGNDVEYRWFAQLPLTASGGRFTCGSRVPGNDEGNTYVLLLQPPL